MTNIRSNLRMIMHGIRTCYSLEKYYCASALLSACLEPASSLLSTYLLSNVVNDLFGKNYDGIAMRVGVMLFVIFLLYIMHRLLQHCFDIRHTQFMQNESMMFSRKLMNVPYADACSSQMYELMAKVKTQSHNGYNMYYLVTYLTRCISGIMTIVLASAMLIPIFIAGLPIWWVLSSTLISLISVLFSSKLNTKVGAVKLKLYSDFAPHNARDMFYSDLLDDYGLEKDVRLSGIADIMLEQQMLEDNECNTLTANAGKKSRKYIVTDAILTRSTWVLTYMLAIIGCIYSGMQPGDITKLVILVSQITGAIVALTKGTRTLIDNNTYLKDYFKLMEWDEASEIAVQTTKTPSDNANISARHLYFKYPNTDEYVIKDMSFDIQSGEHIAIVGENGSGKSTLIKLLSGLYSPTSGTLQFSGRNITDWIADGLWKSGYKDGQISTMFQDSSLLAFKIGQNLAAQNNWDDMRACDAIDHAMLSKRMQSMPLGLDTPLFKDFDESGVELSGGEMQKFVLARAYYSPGRVLLMDEPTAALDAISESDILDSVSNFTAKQTVIIVTHRLSCVAQCDRIFVIDGGQLVQCGTHKDLLQNENGKYYKLWNAQADLYANDK